MPRLAALQALVGTAVLGAAFYTDNETSFAGALGLLLLATAGARYLQARGA